MIDWQHVKRVRFSETFHPLQCHMAGALCNSWKIAPCCFRSKSICDKRNARECSLSAKTPYYGRDRKRERDEARAAEIEDDLKKREVKANSDYCKEWRHGKVSSQAPTPTNTNSHHQPPIAPVLVSQQLPAWSTQRAHILTKEHYMRIFPWLGPVPGLRLPIPTRTMPLQRPHRMTLRLIGTITLRARTCQPESARDAAPAERHNSRRHGTRLLCALRVEGLYCCTLPCDTCRMGARDLCQGRDARAACA